MNSTREVIDLWNALATSQQPVSKSYLKAMFARAPYNNYHTFLKSVVDFIRSPEFFSDVLEHLHWEFMASHTGLKVMKAVTVEYDEVNIYITYAGHDYFTFNRSRILHQMSLSVIIRIYNCLEEIYGTKAMV